MNIYELTERDFLRAKINFENAKRKPNVPQSELEHLAEFCGGDTMEYIIYVPYLYGAEGIRVRCKTCGAFGGYGDIRKRTTWDLSIPPIFNRETIEDGFKKAREKWNGRADNDRREAAQ